MTSIEAKIAVNAPNYQGGADRPLMERNTFPGAFYRGGLRWVIERFEEQGLFREGNNPLLLLDMDGLIVPSPISVAMWFLRGNPISPSVSQQTLDDLIRLREISGQVCIWTNRIPMNEPTGLLARYPQNTFPFVSQLMVEKYQEMGIRILTGKSNSDPNEVISELIHTYDCDCVGFAGSSKLDDKMRDRLSSELMEKTHYVNVNGMYF